MKKKIILITSYFPYSHVETFLETEIKYWEKQDDIDFIIMPKRESNNLRNISDSIKIDHSLIDNPIENINKLKMLFNILKSSVFYKEIFNNKIINLKKMRHTIIACRDYLYYRIILKDYLIKNRDKDIIFYSYWHTEICYALQSLKEEFPNIKVVSRIHGFDLYKERREYNYMPIKDQFLKKIDRIYTISDNAKKYFLKSYKSNTNSIYTSRLGVDNLNITTLPTDINTLHIISCSNIIELKRIDKIIDSIYLLSKEKRSLTIMWTHIGDGVKRKEIEKYAYEKLNNLSNVIYSFLGQLKNQDVIEFYKNTKIDLFLNVSESEGVPVSIMEAMSCHIPIIAPNIGGIGEMIDSKSGYLLSNRANIAEIIYALENIMFYKNETTRTNTYKIFIEKYDAKNNYQFFINELLSFKVIK